MLKWQQRTASYWVLQILVMCLDFILSSMKSVVRIYIFNSLLWFDVENELWENKNGYKEND